MHYAITTPRARSIECEAVLSWYKSSPRSRADKQAGKADDPWRVRVYRRTETEFLRDDDYKEFFMGGSADGAALIFDGELMPTNQRKFTFTDPEATYRTTYSYFIEVEGDPPVGPVPLRHADPEIYWSADRLWAELTRLTGEPPSGPHVELDECGRTGGGHAIPRLTIGRTGPRLALVGLIHPGESGPELIVAALARLLSREPTLFERVQVLALPAVNLDGRIMQAQGTPWYLRRTPTGTDLNRNFPCGWDAPALGYGFDNRDPDAATYRGPAPASAPETRAVMAALNEAPPDVLLSYHALASLCSLPALAPLAAAEDKPYMQRCRTCIEAFASGCVPAKDFNDSWVKNGTSTGSLPLWVYQQYGAPAFDLEMGGSDPDEWQRARRDETDRALLRQYQQMHTDGLHALLRTMANEPALHAQSEHQ